MSPATGRWTNQRVETIIGNLLRGGVILAAGVVSIGGGILSAALWCDAS